MQLNLDLGSDYIGKTLKFSSKIFNKDVSTSALKAYISNSQVASVDIPVNSSFNSYNLQFEYTGTAVISFINYGSTSGQEMFIDDLKLEVIS